MDIIRKIQYLLFCLLAIGFVACDDDDNNSSETGHEGILTECSNVCSPLVERKKN